jgi:hypothetical protein
VGPGIVEHGICTPQERTYIVWYEYTIQWHDLSGNEQTLNIRNPHRPESDFTMRIFAHMEPNPLEQPVTFTTIQTLYDGVQWSNHTPLEEVRVRALCTSQEIPFDRIIRVTMAPVAKWITEIMVRPES